MITCRQAIDKRKEIWSRFKDSAKDEEYIKALSEHLISEHGELMRKELVDKPEHLIEMFFTVVDKNMNTVPFFLNDVQQDFLKRINDLEQQYRRGERTSIKVLVLKGRQQGFTTAITGSQMARAIITKNFSGFTLSDSSANTTTIFEDKARYVYNALPDAVKPTSKYNNRREFHFEKLNSRWRVDTAGNKEVGRSKTINFFHGSEAAFWDSIKGIMTGLGEALTKDSIQILETTANGMNEYQELWSDADAGNNNWVPMFYEWWKTPEYRLPFESKANERRFRALVEDAPNTDDEFNNKLHWLRFEKKLEWEQLYWFYKKYLDLGENLKQEYPCTPEEAFLASGRPRFDIPTLMHYKEHCTRGVRGHIQNGTFIKDESGLLEVWIFPKRGKRYVIGADVASGETVGSNKDPDYSVAAVFDEDSNLCALWRGRPEPDWFGKQVLIPLGTMYNYALLAPEVNNNGQSTRDAIKDDYDNIYQHVFKDKVTDEETKKLGWHTTPKSKPIIINHMASVIKAKDFSCKSDIAIKEMMKYVIEDNGSTNASSGHDDCVMAIAIALYVLNESFMSMSDPVGGWAVQREKGDYMIGDDGRWRHWSEVEDEEDDFLSRW